MILTEKERLSRVKLEPNPTKVRLSRSFQIPRPLLKDLQAAGPKMNLNRTQSTSNPSPKISKSTELSMSTRKPLERPGTNLKESLMDLPRNKVNKVSEFSTPITKEDLERFPHLAAHKTVQTSLTEHPDSSPNRSVLIN